jgi:transcriptional regulator with XRE-family HTH domain
MWAMARSSRVTRRLGERIQALRRDRELTQEVLAHRCGISQKYLSELERGEKAPSWDTLVALAHRGFQITLAALLFAIDEEIATDPHHLDEILAGRSEESRQYVVKAVELLLRAGEKSR